MDTELSSEQEELRDTVRRLLTEQAPIERTAQLWEDPVGRDPGVWKQLAELGLVGLLVPEAHGGAGAGMIEAGIVLEEMGRVVLPAPYLSSAVGAVSAALALDAAELLPGLADGSRIGTLALMETGADPRAWRTPGCTANAGRVTGEKSEVIDAAWADVLLVTTDDGVYAIDTAGPGVVVQPTPDVDGARRLARVRLDGAPGQRLGDVGALAPALDRVLLGIALDALGAARAAHERAVEYAKTREQFGKPIGAFQAVAHLCAESLQTVELGRAGAYHALWAADHADDTERHRTAVMARAWAADEYPQVGASAIQIHGGIGFTWELDLHYFYKRLLGSEQLWGGATVWYDELATLVGPAGA